MKKNDLLDQFYKKRKSIMLRVFFSIVLILALITVSLELSKEDEFIAKIYIEGIIHDRKDLIEQIDALADNQNVKGLITIVNSPGGTYVASKELYDSIKILSKTIPTVVYMKEMATSGGYLASLSSDRIYSNAGTITGSVGVILQTADISVLLDKIGINPVIVKSGELKAVPNPAEKVDDYKLRYLEDVIKKMQIEFLNIVREDRNVTESIIQVVADGRILTGREAKKLKLIDDIGNERDALNWLKKEADVKDDIKIKDLSSQKNLENILDLSFFKKKINYFNQNFYNGFFAIWMPGI